MTGRELEPTGPGTTDAQPIRIELHTLREDESGVRAVVHTLMPGLGSGRHYLQKIVVLTPDGVPMVTVPLVAWW